MPSDLLGGEEEAGMTGNSHMHAPVDGNHAAKADHNHAGGGGVAKEETHKGKEKSVLQAKLTKLAIQIGYAGKHFFVTLIFQYPDKLDLCNTRFVIFRFYCGICDSCYSSHSVLYENICH